MQLPLPQNESSRLESLRSFRVLGTPREQAFDDITHLAALICDASVAVIAFIDEQSVWFKSKIGLQLDEIPRDGSFCAYAILQSDVLTVPDPLSDERFMSSLLVKQVGIQFYAGIPLITHDTYPLASCGNKAQGPDASTSPNFTLPHGGVRRGEGCEPLRTNPHRDREQRAGEELESENIFLSALRRRRG